MKPIRKPSTAPSSLPSTSQGGSDDRPRAHLCSVDLRDGTRRFDRADARSAAADFKLLVKMG